LILKVWQTTEARFLAVNPDHPNPPSVCLNRGYAPLCRISALTALIFIEAESNKIGQIHVPSALWASMRQASRVSLTAPIDARIAFLQRDYRHIIEQPEHLIKLLARASPALQHRHI